MRPHFFARLLLLGTALIGVGTAGSAYAARAVSTKAGSTPEIGVAPGEDSTALRVCADPNYLPFSNKAGEGFENKIAEIVAKAMGRKLVYYWSSERGPGGYPNFLADALDVGNCDVVMSLPAGDPEEGGTDPYYESAYVFISKKADTRAQAVTAMSSPALRAMKIGVQDDTTPVSAIQMLGLVDNAVSFDVADDPNVSPRILLDAVKSGQVDIVVTWQPAIGAFLKDYPDLTIREVPPEFYGPGLPQVTYAYKIAMGVRKKDTGLRDALNTVINGHKQELSDALASSGVRFYSGKGAIPYN
nr:transporter substrate-binding domain-containing protein [Acidomonas methanolica]